MIKNNGIDAIIIKSHDTSRLAGFYKNMGIEFHEEDHGNGLHYGAKVGSIHFAIHNGNPGNLSISFSVDDVDDVIDQLKKVGAKVILEPEDRQYGRLASVIDPDGNEVFFHKYQYISQ